jgi:hypothetical protein
MGNVISLSDHRKSKARNIINEDKELSLRIERIKASINHINKLMIELRGKR